MQNHLIRQSWFVPMAAHEYCLMRPTTVPVLFCSVFFSILFFSVCRVCSRWDCLGGQPATLVSCSKREPIKPIHFSQFCHTFCQTPITMGPTEIFGHFQCSIWSSGDQGVKMSICLFSTRLSLTSLSHVCLRPVSGLFQSIPINWALDPFSAPLVIALVILWALKLFHFCLIWHLWLRPWVDFGPLLGELFFKHP